jgi:hypothetical protein
LSAPFEGALSPFEANSMVSEGALFGGAPSPLGSFDTVDQLHRDAVHDAGNVRETVSAQKRQTSFGGLSAGTASVGTASAKDRPSLFGTRGASAGDSARRPSVGGTSVGSEGPLNFLEVKCNYLSEQEIEFEMPSLKTLNFAPGIYLVQVSLNSSEWSEPHEESCFEVFENTRGGAHRRGATLLPHLLVVRGPADSNSSKAAWRILKSLMKASKRRLAHNDAAATNNARVRKELLLAETVPHLPRPSLGAVARVAAQQVDEHGSKQRRRIRFPLRVLPEAPHHPLSK